MFGGLKASIVMHFRQNAVLYLVVVFAFITGIATGAFTVAALSPDRKVDVGNFLHEFFNNGDTFLVDRGAIFRESIWQHIQTTFLIWLMGIFFWGIPFILVLVGIRGFFIGFTVGFMVEYYGFGGFLFSISCILPQSLIYVPCYIGMGVIAVKSCIESFKRRRISYGRVNKYERFAPYTVRILLLFAMLLIGSLLETFVIPLLFPFFTWIF